MPGSAANDKSKILERSLSEIDGNATEENTESATKRSIISYEAIGGTSDAGYNHFPNDPEFAALIRELEIAIDSGVKPDLSYKGTSGCYFIKDKYGVFIDISVLKYLLFYSLSV